jgi:hypothetical protein
LTPSIVWRNSLRPDLALHDFAFAQPLNEDEDGAFTLEEKIFLSDRYGGQGMAWNSGGVRCGSIGGVQIKGIGQSVLASARAPFWHSYGGATLREAIREAVWGEVCHQALPYGAARVFGIITTGTTVTARYAQAGVPDRTPRALIIREASVRPAHFMRATPCQPSPALLRDYPSDTQRTAAVLGSLGTVLAQFYEKTASTADLASFINAALSEMLGRIATQVAHARAKRIVHSAISESNICIDGRFIDFGMTSAVSDYGKIIVAKGMPDATRQHSMLASGIDDLIYYIKRYLPAEQAAAIAPAVEFKTGFERAIRRHEETAFLELTGLPAATIQRIDHSARHALFHTMQEITKAGNQEPFKLLCACDTYLPRMPARMGSYHLNTILQYCNLSRDAEEAHALLGDELPATLRYRFVDAYWDFRRQGLAASAQGRALDEVFFKINCHRLNAPMPDLFSPDLNRAIDTLVQQGADAGDFIADIIKRMTPRCAYPVNGSFRLDDGVLVSQQHGITIDGTSAAIADIVNLLSAMNQHHSMDEIWTRTCK